MKTNRRGFLKGAFLALASLPVLESLLGNSAQAGMTEVDKTKGSAKNFAYVSNIAECTDATKCDKKFKAGSKCCSCSFYTKIDNEWGNCSLVKPGNVKAAGWCKMYAKKGNVTC
ncbi:MAG: high-potential iron-sulfur protein [Bacteriovoracaceae bacterium]